MNVFFIYYQSIIDYIPYIILSQKALWKWWPATAREQNPKSDNLLMGLSKY